MMDIMIDIDDVMMPWAETVHLKCGDLGLHDGSVPWGSWEMWNDYGCTKEDWLYAVTLAVHEGLYTQTDPYPGVVDTVNRLRWYGHKVHIVTARGFMEKGEEIRLWTPQWLQNFGIGYDTLTFSKNKAEAMEELGVFFDLAIDDGIHNFEVLDKAGVKVYLHTQPHNINHPTERRVSSMWEFGKIVALEGVDREIMEAL